MFFQLRFLSSFTVSQATAFVTTPFTRKGNHERN